MKSELEKLIELQKTDTNIRRLKKSIDTADERRASIEQEFEQHASSIREIQANRDTLREERAELEKQIAENKTYLERADRNLKHSQNQKEYETAMRETDSLQKQIGTLETQALEKMTAIEELEKTLEERAEEINGLESKRDAALAVFDKRLAKALQPTFEETLRASIKKDPRPFVDAVTPVMGTAIRKAIAEALGAMMQSLNRTLDNSVSVRSLQWRLEAARTGKPFAEIVLLHTLEYRVEQVFLIHRETGLLLQHAVSQ